MIGYKIIFSNDSQRKRLLVTLEIPQDAKTNLNRPGLIDPQHAKYRCDKALVVSIHCQQSGTEYTTGISGFWSDTVVYTKNEIVSSEFNPDLENSCSTGIHFFIDKQTAMCYRMCEVKWNMSGTEVPIKTVELQHECPNGVYPEYVPSGYLCSEYIVYEGYVISITRFNNPILGKKLIYTFEQGVLKQSTIHEM